MTAKEYLHSVYQANVRMAGKLNQIQELSALATKCTSTITGMPHNPSPNRSPLEDAVCKLIEAKEDAEAELARLVTLKCQALQLISQVEDAKCRSILEKRYVHGEAWTEIASAMNKSTRWVFALHGKALSEVDEIMKRDGA